MIRTLSLAIALTLAASSASALQCKDKATGRFIPCKAAVVVARRPVVVAPVVARREVLVAPVAGAVVARPVVLARHPHCVKGKPCGGSCIAMAKVCHKPG